MQLNDVTTILQTGLLCGLSAPKWRTVRSTILPTHQNQQTLWTNFQSIRRTVRSQAAECPQLTPQNHQRQRRLWTNFKLYCGPSGPPWRTVRSHSADPPETTTSLDKILDYGGLSALQKRTVRSSTLQNPPETTSSLDKVRTLRRTVRSPIADRPQFNPTKTPETTSSLDNF